MKAAEILRVPPMHSRDILQQARLVGGGGVEAGPVEP
jgi:hypothetical protein